MPCKKIRDDVGRLTLQTILGEFAKDAFNLMEKAEIVHKLMELSLNPENGLETCWVKADILIVAIVEIMLLLKYSYDSEEKTSELLEKLGKDLIERAKELRKGEG